MRTGPLILLGALALLPLAGAQPAPYDGPLFDTHAHVDDDGYGTRLAAVMGPHGVDRAVLFVHMDPDDPADTHEMVREDLADHPGRFVLFFHVDPSRPADLDPARLAAAHDVAPDAFRGIGEFALYRDPWLGTRITDPPWPAVFDWAAGRGLVLMVHLRHGGQDADLDRMLADHPDTTVLLHGPEYAHALPGLLQTHPNLWFTLDTATLLQLPGPGRPGSILMYPENLRGDEFASTFDANRAEILENALRTWGPVVAAAPDRVMWGTDASLDWHADPGTYERLIGFSREFIARLPADQRPAFAWSNADGLLGDGVRLEPVDDRHDGPLGEAPGLTVPVVALLATAAAVVQARRR